MPSKQELQSLLERVEGAAGPDRRIDRDLSVLPGGPNWRVVREGRVSYFRHADKDGNGRAWAFAVFDECDDSDADLSDAAWPFYTRSVDAALALVERAAGGDGTHSMVYSYDLNWNASAHAYMACVADLKVAVGEPPVMSEFHGQSYTLPLAILAAFLKLLIAQSDEVAA